MTPQERKNFEWIRDNMHSEMPQEDVIKLACQAFGGLIKQEERNNFIAFAELVAKQAYLDGLENGIKAEREACAKLCENYGDEAFVDGRINADHHAYLIRQRGQA